MSDIEAFEAQVDSNGELSSESLNQLANLIRELVLVALNLQAIYLLNNLEALQPETKSLDELNQFILDTIQALNDPEQTERPQICELVLDEIGEIPNEWHKISAEFIRYCMSHGDEDTANNLGKLTGNVLDCLSVLSTSDPENPDPETHLKEAVDVLNSAIREVLNTKI